MQSSTTQTSPASTHTSSSDALRNAETSGFATGMPGGHSSSNSHGLNGSSTRGQGIGHSSSTGLGHSSISNGTGLGHSDHTLNNHGISSSNGVHSTNSHSSTLGNSSTDSPHTTHSNGPRHNAAGPGFAHDATGAHASVGDKIAGTAQTLAGKVTKDSKQVIEGQTRKSEGKDGVQAAKSEGVL
ncbi:hypothetical protein JCM5350_005303 [Sporobolomyces pararoseus]